MYVRACACMQHVRVRARVSPYGNLKFGTVNRAYVRYEDMEKNSQKQRKTDKQIYRLKSKSSIYSSFSLGHYFSVALG